MAVKLRSVSRASSDFWGLIRSWLALKSPNTVRQYNGAIRSWCAFLGIEPYRDDDCSAFLSAGDHDVYEYISQLKSRPAQRGRSAAIAEHVCSATVCRTVIILHTVYRELQRARYVEENPFSYSFEHLKKGGTPLRRPSQLIPFDFVKQILDRPDRSEPGRRDAAFLALLFGGGLRISEALGLTLSDITEHDGCAVVVLRDTKNGESYSQVISFGASDVLDYLRLRLQGNPISKRLFVSYTAGRESGPWSVSSAHRTFKRYCVSCGLPDYSPHCARATAITKLLEDGVSHRDVATFSRHGSVQMVERYDKRRLSISDAIAKKLKF